MGKLSAKVTFRNDEEKAKLIMAFFKEFNPENSSISVTAEEGIIKLDFEVSPMEIIEAISNCKVEEMSFKVEKNENIGEEKKINEKDPKKRGRPAKKQNYEQATKKSAEPGDEIMKSNLLPEISAKDMEGLSLRQKIDYMLQKMGISKIPKEQQHQIEEYVGTAMKLENITTDNIFENVNLSKEDKRTVQMNLAALLKNYFDEQGSKEKVKTPDFLIEMKKAIVM